MCQDSPAAAPLLVSDLAPAGASVTTGCTWSSSDVGQRSGPALDVWQPEDRAHEAADESDASGATTPGCEGIAADENAHWHSSPVTATATDKPCKGRKAAAKSSNCKQRQCMYEHCPSPMHSSKWRVVTETTVAGARDWQPLCGMTLCDSCYSTYRKHGTFIRSVRTPEGWARFDHSAQTHILNKPTKKRTAPAPRPAKRSRPASSVEPVVKRERRNTMLSTEDDVDLLQAGRPRRDRKPSAKLRDVMSGSEDADVEAHDSCFPTETYHVPPPPTGHSSIEEYHWTCQDSDAYSHESSDFDQESNFISAAIDQDLGCAAGLGCFSVASHEVAQVEHFLAF